MSRVLPILFNTEMVRAILDGRKTVTRRLVKIKYWPDEYSFQIVTNKATRERRIDTIDEDGFSVRTGIKPPYELGDVLYVRESIFQGVRHYLDVGGETVSVLTHDFEYYADGLHEKDHWKDKHERTWMHRRPSIHMPKEAARIFLKVKDVRVERLQDITEEQTEEEGFQFTPPCLSRVSEDSYCDLDGPCTSKVKYCDMSAGELFGKVLWNSTIKKADLDKYGWEANPWVWVIEFERCEKPEEW